MGQEPDFEGEEDDHYDPAEDHPEEDAALSAGPRGRTGRGRGGAQGPPAFRTVPDRGSRRAGESPVA